MQDQKETQSCGGERNKLAIHEETFKPTFLAASPKLQVRPFLVVYAEGPLSASWAEVAYGFIQRYQMIYTYTSI
jgi:hypothetical protein